MHHCRLSSWINTVFLFINLLLLSGCFWGKKNINDNQNTTSDIFILPDPQYPYEKISQEYITNLGFIVLPFYQSIICYKKSNILYIVDTIYHGNFENFQASYQTLKDLYCASGWTLEEECITDQYIHLFFTQVNKNITIFIQEKKSQNQNNHNEEYDTIFLHQTMITN